MIAQRISLLSVDDVARVFGNTPRTLRRWAAEGTLVPIQIGGTLYYPQEEVEEVISSAVVDREIGKSSRLKDVSLAEAVYDCDRLRQIRADL